MAGTTRRALASLGLVLVSVALALPPGHAPRCSGVQIHQRLLAAVVWVQSPDRARGTGFVVDVGRRWVITSDHVVGEHDSAEVIFPWREDGLISDRARYLAELPRLRERKLAVRGQVIRRDVGTDLVLLQLPTLPTEVEGLSLARRPAMAGEWVHLVGNRGDLDTLWTYATGSIRTSRMLPEGYFSAGRRLAKGARTLLATVPILEGDSGAPLVNADGEVVGVAAAVAWELGGAGLFIDAREVLRLLTGEGPPQTNGVNADYLRAVRGTVAVQYDGGPIRAGVLLAHRRPLILTTAQAVGKEGTVEILAPVEQAGGIVSERAWYRREESLLRRKGALLVGTVLGRDVRRNLALVELPSKPKGMHGLSLAHGQAGPGQRVGMISHPRLIEVMWLHGEGWIRQRARARLGETSDDGVAEALLLQAPLQEGEEGGPILDATGALVGIASGRVRPQQQVAYAVTTGEIAAFLNEQRGWIEPGNAAEHLARARRFLQVREVQIALHEAEAAMALDPTLVDAWVVRARVELLLEQFEKASASCEKAMRMRPNALGALCCRVAISSARGESERAESEAEHAVRTHPRAAEAYLARAEVRFLRGKLTAALADVDEAIWIDARSAAAYALRGRLYRRQGDTDRAQADLSHALALDPALTEAWVDRSHLHWKKNDPQAARHDLERAIRLTPGAVRRAKLQEQLREWIAPQ